MQARYTPLGGKPEAVDITEFAAETMLDTSVHMRQRAIAETIARLIDLLAANGIMNGGQVLHVLGFTHGTLEIEEV